MEFLKFAEGPRSLLIHQGEIAEARDWLYGKAEGYEGMFRSNLKYFDFDPRWIIEQANNRRAILGSNSEEETHGKVRTKYQGNWYQGVYSIADSAILCDYLSPSTRSLVAAFSEYANITGLDNRWKTKVDVALGTEVLDWIISDLESVIKSQKTKRE